MALIGLRVYFGFYERILYGTRSARHLAKASIHGTAFSCVVLLIASNLTRDLLPLFVLIAMLGGPLVSLITNRAEVSKLNSRTLPEGEFSPASAEHKQRAKHFWILQLCGATAFGFDQLVVSTLLSPSEAASFSAHSRFFQIGAAFLTVAIASVWPPISAAISRSDFEGARRTYTRAVIVVSLAAVCWTVPMLSGLIRVSFFKSGERNQLGLILPMALWFVLWQVGVLIGQVQAALRDLKYLVKIGCLMALANVFFSVLLCLQFGAAGVVWGSIISYPIIVLIPTLRRLGKSSFWKSAL
jgi:hypothetical protein